MAIILEKDLRMRRRRVDGDDDVYYPLTKARNVMLISGNTVEQEIVTHKTNDANPHNVSSQQINVISERLVGDLPSTYPIGTTAFQLGASTAIPWRDNVGIFSSSTYAIVETVKTSSYTVQRITFMYVSDEATKGTYQREGVGTSWRSWKKVLNQDDLDAPRTIIGNFSDTTTTIPASGFYTKTIPLAHVCRAGRLYMKGPGTSEGLVFFDTSSNNSRALASSGSTSTVGFRTSDNLVRVVGTGTGTHLISCHIQTNNLVMKFENIRDTADTLSISACVWEVHG